MIVILKPRFLPCVYVRALENGTTSLVKLFGKEIEVKNKDIKIVKIPNYHKN